jgi:hypothetical protein
VFWAGPGGIVASDRRSRDRRQPFPDNNQDLRILNSWIDGGFANVVFTREYVTGDPDDKEIRRGFNDFLWALGPNPPQSNQIDAPIFRHYAYGLFGLDITRGDDSWATLSSTLLAHSIMMVLAWAVLTPFG